VGVRKENALKTFVGGSQKRKCSENICGWESENPNYLPKSFRRSRSAPYLGLKENLNYLPKSFRYPRFEVFTEKI
jgi:hypothetical protein